MSRGDERDALAIKKGARMIIRLSKVLLAASAGVFALLVGIDNLLDYGTNLVFVEHVLSMDTTFADSGLRWRAITSPWLHHAAYWLIIAAELVTGALCLAGAWRLYAARAASAARFNAAKDLAVAGLACGFLLYFLGFLVVGGEWFKMWQSETWNAQAAAFRFAACFALVLIFVVLRDEELE
jgi:predicted small integral membrane protein